MADGVDAVAPELTALQIRERELAQRGGCYRVLV